MLTFPKTQVDRFYSEFWPERKGKQRVGQAFHEYAKLEKITNEKDKLLCDKVYQADGTDPKDLGRKNPT